MTLTPAAPAAGAPRRPAVDLLALRVGDHYELVDGVLVEKQMGMCSAWVANRIERCLAGYECATRSGWAPGADAGYQCCGEYGDRARRPDASFLHRGRIPCGKLPGGHCRVGPDLTVEVSYPHDLSRVLWAKTEEYLAAGGRLVWIVDPDTRTVAAHRPDGSGAVSHAGDILAAEDVLPGFRCPVADLFPPD